MTLTLQPANPGLPRKDRLIGCVRAWSTKNHTHTHTHTQNSFTLYSSIKLRKLLYNLAPVFSNKLVVKRYECFPRYLNNVLITSPQYPVKNEISISVTKSVILRDTMQSVINKVNDEWWSGLAACVGPMVPRDDSWTLALLNIWLFLLPNYAQRTIFPFIYCNFL